jgi:hypothetical protein
MGRKLARSLRLPLQGTTVTMSAPALSILPCSDDGLTPADLRALEQAVVRAGDGVVRTGPVDDQSGRGGFVTISPAPDLPESNPASRPTRSSRPPPGNPCSASS